MQFRNFADGQIWRAGPMLVTERDIVEFAEKFDPQWFHIDVQRSAAGRWGGLIASGWHTCAIAMRLASDAVLEDADEAIGSPGLIYLKWPAPVRPGDQLRFEGHVISAKIRRGHLGLLRWRWLLLNQDDAEVLDLETTSLFDVEPETEQAAE